MEHAQRATTYDLDEKADRGLNPYFNGTCSKRAGKTSKQRVTIKS